MEGYYEILHNYRHNILGMPTSEEDEKIGLGSEKKVCATVFHYISFLYYTINEVVFDTHF